MAGLDHPMAIVTTASGEVRSGCLVGFHCQCGIDPPRYAIWLSKGNHTYRVGRAVRDVRRALPDAPTTTSWPQLFGTDTGDDVDKFTRCAWTRGPDDVPLLDACPIRFVGRRVALVDAGPDHVCLILEPVDGRARSTPSRRRDRPRLMFRDVLDLPAGHDRHRPAATPA